MSDKKSFGCFLYAFCSIIVFVAFITLIVLGTKDIINMNIGFWGAITIGSVWFFISTKISKKQQAKIPALQSQAVLTEKIQESHRGPSSYFLYFTLEDGSKKTFRVERDIYAAFSKNERGLLKYKKTHPKEHWLSNKFLSFETE